ncbi:tetratricopeptide repeat protein [Shewanella japonica]|uniref:tetratricopeptide repeat protein n=1 Tax=Shewanella japonica TaxID=93973 RepID=UPI0024953C8C|nr:tetratricopeptide repeat protein [Shewanella japonica]
MQRTNPLALQASNSDTSNVSSLGSNMALTLPKRFGVSRLVSCLVLISLAGCQLTDESPTSSKQQRPTLTDLANSQPQVNYEKQQLSQAQRKAKLALIYQQLLTLEPDPEVRTHVEYRLVQIKSEHLEEQMFGEAFDEVAGQQTDVSAQEAEQLALTQLKHNVQQLDKLIAEYQVLLNRYPDRAENEHLQYQLAKALDVQGEIDASLIEMESLLTRYPHTQYRAELNFRRGEIYYNLQDYPAAIQAYQQVESANDNDKYLINSIYMSGWALFKLNRLPEADAKFLQVFDNIIAANEELISTDNEQLTQTSFEFNKLASRYQNLAIDAQRVLSISLSQQEQSRSLLNLVNQQKSSPYLTIYQHVLFDNLAKFLLKKELQHDAELTYQTYIEFDKNNIWAARYSLALLDLYQQQGKFASMHRLKDQYVEQYGLSSQFWTHANTAQQQEVLPHLLAFSDEHSRRLYASAQQLPPGQARIDGFKTAASALSVYLQLAKLPQAKSLLTKPIHSDEYLFADANYEAQQFKQALISYEAIAYAQKDALALPVEQLALQQKAAFATTLTIRAILSQHDESVVKGAEITPISQSKRQSIISDRTRLDKLFIANHPLDKRALELATDGAQYAFNAKQFDDLIQFSQFVLLRHKVINQANSNSNIGNKNDSEENAHAALVVNQQAGNEPESRLIRYDNSQVSNHLRHGQALSSVALTQVQVVSQLYAHSLYQQSHYIQAESAYDIALNYLNASTNLKPQQHKAKTEIRNLLASSIYFQAQANKAENPALAVKDLKRISTRVPESPYAINGQFEAANILLSQQKWQQAIEVLVPFQQRYPNHEFSATIPAKLAQSYEALEEWELAAEQLLIIVANQPSTELKREAQYTAAEYYLKAGNTEKARLTFRTYARTYPEPFDLAQEVRLKMSGFYQVSNEPNKEYYWYRQILSADKKQRHQALAIGNREVVIASIAAISLAKAHQQTFKTIKLTAPLNKTLKRKQDEMKLAINYYQQVLDFQQAQYVPQATYELAEMYRQLAADVMDSERPSDLDELALEEYEILLEELAYPFEEKAIEIHISNSQRAWQNIYDQWVGKSFATLTELSPALYNKPEVTHDVIEAIH